MYANDTLTTMTDAKALAKFGGKVSKRLKIRIEEVLSSLIKGSGDLYDFTIYDDTWFMYYFQIKCFSEEDIKNRIACWKKGLWHFL